MRKCDKIVIVAGGLATRMLPITEDIPKCLIDINGKPLIQHQIEFFRDNGFTDIVFCVAHLAEKIKDYFKDGKNLGVNIEYVQEKNEAGGTAGSVKLAERLIGTDEDFMVYYGDNLTSMNFKKFIKFHREKKGIATICIRPCPVGYKSSSIITLDNNSKVNVFLEKPSSKDFEKYKRETTYINSGIYMLNREIFKLIPQGKKYDFAEHLFLDILRKRLGIYGYITEEFYREVGRIEKYQQVLKEFAGKKKIL